jgi:predicted SnoaL-like aldol condensation-catalyzing enzyme
MKPKDIVAEFYKSDIFLDKLAVTSLLHPDVTIDWNSSKGFIQMNFDDIINLVEEMSKTYIRSKIKMSHILEDGNSVAVRFSHFVKTIENPREEMLLAHFFVIWEIKDGKLFKGYQMSQFS